MPWLAALVVLLLGPLALARGLPSPDVSWLLHAAGRMLEGARLGVDLHEVTPPVILWLSMPAVALARVTGQSPWAAWVGLVTLGAVASALATIATLPTSVSWLRGRWAQVGLLALLLLAPGDAFGMREHLALLFTLPMLAVLARRLAGEPVASRSALVLGAVAGFGWTIKPHFLLVPVLLWVLVHRRTSGTAWRGPEWWAMAGGMGVHALLTLALHPGWLADVRAWGPLYLAYQRESMWLLLFAGPAVALAWLGVLAWGALNRWAAAAAVVLWPLVACVVGFLAAAVAQGKGWHYQFLAADLVALGLLAVLVAATPAALPRVLRLYRAAAGAVVLFVLGGALAAGMRGLLDPAQGPVPPPPGFAGVRALLAEAGPGAPVGAISPNVMTGFPVVPASGARWIHGSPATWQFSALYARELAAPGQFTPRAPGAWRPLERRVVDELRRELERSPPEVLLVLLPGADARDWSGGRRMDYLAYLGADSAFAAFLDGYAAVQVVEPYAVLRRAARGDSWRALVVPPAVASGRPIRVALPRVPVGGMLLLGLVWLCWWLAPTGPGVQSRRAMPSTERP